MTAVSTGLLLNRGIIPLFVPTAQPSSRGKAAMFELVPCIDQGLVVLVSRSLSMLCFSSSMLVKYDSVGCDPSQISSQLLNKSAQPQLERTEASQLVGSVVVLNRDP